MMKTDLYSMHTLWAEENIDARECVLHEELKMHKIEDAAQQYKYRPNIGSSLQYVSKPEAGCESGSHLEEETPNAKVES